MNRFLREILALLHPLRLKRSLRLGLKSLWVHRLRSLLTALGIVFGVASVIAMLAIGEGASSEAQNQIRRLGSQNIIVESVKPDTQEDMANNDERSYVLHYGITHRDVRQIESTLPDVELTVPSKVAGDFARHLRNTIPCEVHGTVPSYPKMRGLKVLRGRFFSDLEMEGKANVCVLDAAGARRLFPLEDPLGKSVRIRGTYFRVIGIAESVAGDSSQSEESDGAEEGNPVARVLVPLTALMERFGQVLIKVGSGSFQAEKVEFSEITVRVAEMDQVVPTANALRRIFEKNHDKPDYQLVVPVELLRQAERTKQIFNTVLGSIAAISLLVGGIGIMNIMLATVTERTREIGIRRALGARRADIVFQFLIETVLLSGSGGLIGVALGLGIPAVVSRFADMPTEVRLWAPTLAFSISLVIGVLFGIYPALRAARMDPVEALRHE